MNPYLRSCAALALLCLGGSVAVVTAADVEPARPVRVSLDARAGLGLELLETMRIDVDGVDEARRHARIYVTDEQIAKLRSLGFRLTRLAWNEPRRAREAQKAAPPRHLEKGGAPTAYHTYETLTQHLANVAADRPDLVRVTSIGQSHEGRELWMVKISRNPDLDEDEPEFAYISSMHGDEVVGKELLVGLLDYLIANDGSNARVTELLDTTEIWLMPSMNPDGTARGWRQNARGFDLNRDFPDHLQDPVNTVEGREFETAAVMRWEETVTINLSANMHGGAVVVNYPFDGDPNGLSGLPNPSPDDDLFVSMSLTYAQNNSRMTNSSPFTDGITNGSDWYTVYGGLQDWCYVYNGNYDVTLELGSDKWPPATDLPLYWDENLESMLVYLERVHEGARGLVTDAVSGQPLAARVYLVGNPIPIYTDPDVGDYHRILLPGTYDLRFEAPGYEPRTVENVVVGVGPAVRRDVALTPLPVDLQAIETTVVDEGNGSLEPGEAAALAVTLENLGVRAAEVSGVLVSTGWFAEVTRPLAVFPDVATGEQASSLPPHFEVALDEAVPAGHRPGFAVRWQANGTQGVTAPFFLDVGEPRCATYSAADVPRAIPDLATVSSVLTFADPVVIESLRIGVEIRHPFIGDLRVLLRSPGGTTVRLHDRRGGGVDDIVGDYPPFVTDDPLSDLFGQAADGQWTLEIEDAGPGDVGSLERFEVEVCGRPIESAPPPMRIQDVRREGGGVLLAWWPYPGLDGYRVYRSTDASSIASFQDVTAGDDAPGDTQFLDGEAGDLVFWLVTGVGPRGEGALRP